MLLIMNLLVIGIPSRNQSFVGAGKPNASQWNSTLSFSAASTDCGFCIQYGSAEKCIIYNYTVTKMMLAMKNTYR